MPDFTSFFNSDRARAAWLLGVVAALLTAFAGFVMFLAGCLVLGVDVTLSYPALVMGPGGLLEHGPLGYAAWMALLMAAGSPFVGAGVFAMVFFARR